MKNFEVEIHFPGRKNVLDSEISPDNSAQEILAKLILSVKSAVYFVCIRPKREERCLN